MSTKRPKRRPRGDKTATVDLVPDEVWRRALRENVAFVLHHIYCDIMQGGPCDCTPLFVGLGFGVDNCRPSA